MSESPAVTDRPHVPWTRILIVAGAVTILASAVLGFLWPQRMPELQPVEFGQQVQVRAKESTSATIFASTGLSRPPSCTVTSENGDPVALGEAERYRQEGGLESTFGFPVTSGTTYTVTCGGATEAGRFAVAQDAAVRMSAFIAAGSVGLLMCGLGAALTVRRRRAMKPRSHTTG